MARIRPATFAKRIGVTPAAVYKAIKEGRLTRGDDGMLDPIVAEREWREQREQRAPAGRPPDPHAEQLRGARVVKDTYDAKLAELRYKQRAGELVEVVKVREAAFNEARRARDLLKNLAPRIGPVVAGLSDPAACIRAIDEEVQRVLTEIGGAA